MAETYIGKNPVKQQAQGAYGADTGSAWGNVKKGMGWDKDDEANQEALKRKMKSLGTWGDSFQDDTTEQGS